MEDIETDRSNHGAVLPEGAHEACGPDTAAPGQFQANEVDQESRENAGDNPHGIGALDEVEGILEAETARQEHGCRANTHHSGQEDVDDWSGRSWLQGNRDQASALDLRQSGSDR